MRITSPSRATSPSASVSLPSAVLRKSESAGRRPLIRTPGSPVGAGSAGAADDAGSAGPATGPDVGGEPGSWGDIVGADGDAAAGATEGPARRGAGTVVRRETTSATAAAAARPAGRG